MKKLVYTFALLLPVVSSAGVPSSWISTEEPLGKFSSLSGFGNSNAEHAFDQAFSMSSKVVNAKEDPAISKKERRAGWYLQSIKTEIGIEASGEVGIRGFSGEAAAELIWKRTSESLKKVIARKDEPSAGPADEVVTLDSSMTPTQLQVEIERLTAGLERAGKIKNRKRLSKELLTQVLSKQKWVSELAAFDEDAPWKPYKFQLQIFASAEGRVLPVVEAGVAIRIRIEWNIDTKPALKPAQRPSQLAALARELHGVESLSSHNGLFKFAALKVGIGAGVEGDFTIAAGEAELIGSVFLKPVSVASGPKAPSPLSDSDLPFPRENIRKGIMKATEITQTVLDRAEHHELQAVRTGRKRSFELYAVEMEFEISQTGGVALATLKKIGGMEIFFTRKNAG